MGLPLGTFFNRIKEKSSIPKRAARAGMLGFQYALLL
jgi:hypothetical protein